MSMYESIHPLKRGRPKNSGKFGAATKTIRVPMDRIAAVQDFLTEEPFSIPLYLSKISAGLPFSGEDHIDEHIDLNKH